jgi:hypothetical protein
MNTPVSFELAKLLKEKGFNIPQLYFYIDGDISWKVDNTRCRNQIEGEYAAPTIAEVVMWLYEKHEIWVQVSVSRYGKFYCNVLKKENTKSLNNPTSWEMQVQLNDFNSPTEAYEAAIKYTLENLI